MKNAKHIQIYRFCNQVAIAFVGDNGPTHYISKEQAETLATKMQEITTEINSVKGSQSKIGTTHINEQGNLFDGN